MPSIPNNTIIIFLKKRVLNLIITGMPSILALKNLYKPSTWSFKPYYNWNAFNTATN